MAINSLYIDMRYESNDLKFEMTPAEKPPVFVRSDSVVVVGQVAGNLTGLVVKASVCKVLPDGSISPPVYSRTIGNGITMSAPSPNERRVAVALIQVGENAVDRPGQQYVADIEFSYNQDFSVGTTVGTPVPMRRTIKGAFGIEEDYTII